VTAATDRWLTVAVTGIVGVVVVLVGQQMYRTATQGIEPGEIERLGGPLVPLDSTPEMGAAGALTLLALGAIVAAERRGLV